MSKEEKSVRSQVTAIEERTAKLDSVLKKLSDSLDRISESLAKQQPTDNDQPDRQELIKQFKQPFATPQAVTKEGSSDDLLNDIKDSLVLSQKDNFKLFKSIEETLLRIEQMGGSLGGGDTKVKFGGGKGKPDAPDKKATDTKGKKSPTTGKAAQAAEKKAATSTLSKVGSGIAKAAKVLPGVGLAVTAGMAAYEGVQGFTNAEDTLGIEGREATLGEKFSAAGGSIVEGLSFGSVSGKSAGNFFAGMFGAGPDAEEKEKEAQKAVEAGVPPEQAAQVAEQAVSDDFDAMATSMTSITPVSEEASIVKKAQTPVSTAGAIATANVRGASPDFKYIQEQRRKREAIEYDKGMLSVADKGIEMLQPLSEDNDARQKYISDFKKSEAFTKMSPEQQAELETRLSTGDLTVENVSKNLSNIRSARNNLVEAKEKGISMEGLVRAAEQVAPGSSNAIDASLVTKTIDMAQAGVGTPAASVELSRTVNQMSQENADMKTEAPSMQPVVINNQSSVSSNQQSFTPLRTTPRPNNNSFERKQMAVSDY